MVIEYCGEIVRPSVADLREARCYDALVGAGTYVFRRDDAGSVDATRAGNMAHLINHSCAPNCYSRLVTVTGSPGAVPHIVLFALRDIPAGVEISYDYRFASESERLPCNCGAACCRGFVNVDAGDGDGDGEEEAGAAAGGMPKLPPGWLWARREELRVVGQL
jgi:SET domain-containing protein